LFIILLAVYNAFTIPISVAFPEKTIIDSTYMTILGYFIDFFFFVDMIVNFRTTTLNKTGEEVTSSVQIATDYIKS